MKIRTILLSMGAVMLMTLQSVLAAGEPVITYCRFVPERIDDFAWEKTRSGSFQVVFDADDAVAGFDLDRRVEDRHVGHAFVLDPPKHGGRALAEAMIAARDASTVCMATKFSPR